MNATEMRDVLFEELIRARRPFSMLLSEPSDHRVPGRRRNIVRVALEWVDPRTQGVVLFSASPIDWIDVDRVRTLVPEAGDVPLRIQYTGPIFAAAAAGDGVSVPLRSIGSLGALVEDKSTGSRYLLSCNHVIADCNRASPSRTAIYNRGTHGAPLTPGTRLATLDRYHAIDFSAGAINRVDAALGAPKPTTAVSRGIAGKAVSVGIGSLTTPFNVEKRGFTTGHTFGQLTFFASGFALTYATGSIAIFDHQLGLVATATSPQFALPGDSGSVVTDSANDAVGLLFAVTACGSVAFANPINDVMNATTGWNLLRLNLSIKGHG